MRDNTSVQEGIGSGGLQFKSKHDYGEKDQKVNEGKGGCGWRNKSQRGLSRGWSVLDSFNAISLRTERQKELKSEGGEDCGYCFIGIIPHLAHHPRVRIAAAAAERRDSTSRQGKHTITYPPNTPLLLHIDCCVLLYFFFLL